jgi:hypothetical protein
MMTRAAAAVIEVYVRAMVNIRADALTKSAESLGAAFTDSELQGLFDELRPPVEEVRTFVFPRDFQGQ